MHEFRMLLLIMIVGGLVSCRSGNPKPVEIVLNEESCSQCQMAISQRKFAAEAVFTNGIAEFFDDIGCLAGWLKIHKSEEAGIFVVDSMSGEWLSGSAAYYVRSDRFHSPMSYGIRAYKTSADAEAAARQYDGIVLDWTQLIAEDFS